MNDTHTPGRITEALHTFALDELGAELRDDQLYLSDSFGTVILHCHKRGLITEEGELITGAKRLRRTVARSPEAINLSGEQRGTLLTELGVTPFIIQHRRDQRQKSATSVSLHLKRPVRLHGVCYQEMYTTGYDHPTFYLHGGRWTIRAGETARVYDMTPTVSTYLYALSQRAVQSLITPQAALQARYAEAVGRLASVNHDIKQMQRRAAQIQAEIDALAGGSLP